MPSASSRPVRRMNQQHPPIGRYHALPVLSVNGENACGADDDVDDGDGTGCIDKSVNVGRGWHMLLAPVPTLRGGRGLVGAGVGEVFAAGWEEDE